MLSITPSNSLFRASTTKAAFARSVFCAVTFGSKQPVTKTLSYFSLILRMLGGAPEGISLPPGALGWRTKRKRIPMTTMQGRSRTRYRGTLILLLPRMRMRLRKKERRGREASRREVYWSDLRVGRDSAEGRCFCIDLT